MPRSQILLIAFVIFVLDQLAKFLVLEKIELNESITLIPNFLALNHVNNTGIAFSLFNDFPFYLTIFITGLMFYIAYIFFISEKLGLFWAFMLGGGFSNLFDRYLHGSVIDYIETLFIDFPIFNIADIALNIGLLLAIIYALKPKKDSCGF